MIKITMMTFIVWRQRSNGEKITRSSQALSFSLMVNGREIPFDHVIAELNQQVAPLSVAEAALPKQPCWRNRHSLSVQSLFDDVITDQLMTYSYKRLLALLIVFLKGIHLQSLLISIFSRFGLGNQLYLQTRTILGHLLHVNRNVYVCIISLMKLIRTFYTLL